MSRHLICIVAALLLAWVASARATTVTLSPGELAYRSVSVGEHLTEIGATDGGFILVALTSRSDGFLSCVIAENDTSGVRVLLSDPQIKVKDIGVDEIRRTVERCREVQALVDLSQKIIVPGTKWCGPGNIADDYDLGVHKDTDACCREHDHCPVSIKAFGTKYHYWNYRPFTISDCTCDHAFYNCLKGVGSTVSNIVGGIFYGVLGVDCFDLVQGRYCYRYHWTHLWCKEYRTGTVASPKDFPLKW